MKRFAGTLPHPALSEATVALDGKTVRFGDLSADCTSDDVAIYLYGAAGFPPMGTVVRFGSIAIGGRDVVLPDALPPGTRVDMNVAAFLERADFVALLKAVADAREAAFGNHTKGYREGAPREERSRWEPILPKRFPLQSPHAHSVPMGKTVIVIFAAPAACLVGYATHSLTGSSLAGGVLGLVTMLAAMAFIARPGRPKQGPASALDEEALSIEGDDLVYRLAGTESRQPRANVRITRRTCRVARTNLQYAALSIEGLTKRDLLIGVSDTRFAWRDDVASTMSLPRWVWPCMWVDLVRALELQRHLEVRPDAWKKR